MIIPHNTIHHPNYSSIQNYNKEIISSYLTSHYLHHNYIALLMLLMGALLLSYSHVQIYASMSIMLSIGVILISNPLIMD
jgi:hypothetical protein